MATSAIHSMHPYASETGSSAASDTAASTISANDFLTLLVTEMQNQDPTAATDPNEYINQLVNVNSLEQLISINQTLTTAAGDANSTAPSAAPHADTHTDVVSSARADASAPSGTAKSAGAAIAAVAGRQTLAAGALPGNLSLPTPASSAQSIARALAKH